MTRITGSVQAQEVVEVLRQVIYIGISAVSRGKLLRCSAVVPGSSHLHARK